MAQSWLVSLGGLPRLVLAEPPLTSPRLIKVPLLVAKYGVRSLIYDLLFVKLLFMTMLVVQN